MLYVTSGLDGADVAEGVEEGDASAGSVMVGVWPLVANCLPVFTVPICPVPVIALNAVICIDNIPQISPRSSLPNFSRNACLWRKPVSINILDITSIMSTVIVSSTNVFTNYWHNDNAFSHTHVIRHPMNHITVPYRETMSVDPIQ